MGDFLFGLWIGAFNGTFFLILLTVFTIFEIVIFDENTTTSGILFLIGLTLIYFSNAAFHAFVTHEGWQHFLTHYVLGYLIIGVITAAFKWVFHIWKVRDKIWEAREAYANRTSAMIDKAEEKGFSKYTVLAALYEESWHWKQRRELLNGKEPSELKTEQQFIDAVTPNAKKNVDRITFWVLQWPIVILSTLLNDILTKIGREIARLFNYMFNRLAKAITTGALKDF